MSDLFSDLFPDAFSAQTSDDTDLGWGERPEPTPDDFYLDDKPPHWA